MKLTQWTIGVAALSLASAAFAWNQNQQDHAAAGQSQRSDKMQVADASRGALEHNTQIVRDVQQNLSQQGHQVAVDGHWGPQTQNAVKDFQQSKGIQGNGQLDQQTLSALGVHDTNMNAK